MTDEPSPLAAAMAELQTQLPVITKASKAQYGNYADLTDVSKELLPVMGKLGLSFSAKPTYVVREDGTREFVLSYRLLHSSGQYDAGEYPLPQGGTPQALGSAITYARRYCLCAVTGAVAEADDDGQLAEAAAKKAPKASLGKPPERPAASLPRNRDGSTSRSKVTDDELAATGQMTDAQQREHNRLERETKGTGPQGTERLATTPDDDLWQQPAPLRTPQAAQPTRGVIHQHFGRLKFGDDEREQRLAAMSAITGRVITSTNDLSAAEGLKVADFLGRCRDRGVLIERLAVKAGEDIG